MLDDIITKNLLNLGLDEPCFIQQDAKPMAPRLSRSTSFFYPSSKSHSLDNEQLSDDVSGWGQDIWSQAAPTKQQVLFRPDRSMSLTESNILSFGKMNLDALPPPPGFPPLTPQTSPPSNRYKTELCRSFQENGSCNYGSKCQFAHGEAELRGLYRHPKYKTEACRTFYNFGYCPYGTRCHFIHEEKLTPLTQKFATQQGHFATQKTRQLRQSVSFAGFMGSRSSPPLPALHDPLAFTRAPSVSPPPADILSPVFGDTQREAFQFSQSRASVSDVHNIPLIIEPQQKPPRCVCGHGNNLTSPNNKPFAGHVLQRFSSEDSLSDRDSYTSNGSSSGSESPTFDGSASKRLTVFARLSLSD